MEEKINIIQTTILKANDEYKKRVPFIHKMI